MRSDWVKKRRGQPNVSQMHYAREGVVTEEMRSTSRRARSSTPSSSGARSPAAG